MKRLVAKNEFNSPTDYADIFRDRLNDAADEFDVRRWELLASRFTGGRFIDLGCLDSIVPVLAKTAFPNADVWGLDFVPEVIDFMSKQGTGVIYTVGDVYNTKFEDGYFDYVVSGEVIEHLEDPEACIREAFRILKPGGILALSTPLEEENEPGAVDGDRHLWSFTKQDIRDMLKFYSSSVKLKVLGSTWFPYKYSWPNVVAFATKRT